MLLTFVVAAPLFALVTVLAGWWAVAALALVLGALRPPHVARGQARALRPRRVALAAAVAWAALLAGAAAAGAPVWALAGRVAGVFGAPAVVLPLLTVAFASLLAWSAAATGAALRTLFTRPPAAADASATADAPRPARTSGPRTTVAG